MTVYKLFTVERTKAVYNFSNKKERISKELNNSTDPRLRILLYKPQLVIVKPYEEAVSVFVYF